MVGREPMWARFSLLPVLWKLECRWRLPVLLWKLWEPVWEGQVVRGDGRLCMKLSLTFTG